MGAEGILRLRELLVGEGEFRIKMKKTERGEGLGNIFSKYCTNK